MRVQRRRKWRTFKKASIDYVIASYFFSTPKSHSIMSNLVFKIKNILLNGSLDAICSANVVYLAMNGNDLGNYEDVRTLADNAVNSTLMKVTDTERRMKVLEILAEVSDVLIRKLFVYIMMILQQMKLAYMAVNAESWGDANSEERCL